MQQIRKFAWDLNPVSSANSITPTKSCLCVCVCVSKPFSVCLCVRHDLIAILNILITRFLHGVQTVHTGRY